MSHCVPRTLVPVVDLDVVGFWGALAGFDEGFQAHQEDRPLGAAVVHEFYRLFPALVFEEDDGVVVDLAEVPVDVGADPFFGSVDHLPEYALAWVELEDLHVESAGVEPELEYAT